MDCVLPIETFLLVLATNLGITFTNTLTSCLVASNAKQLSPEFFPVE